MVKTKKRLPLWAALIIDLPIVMLPATLMVSAIIKTAWVYWLV